MEVLDFDNYSNRFNNLFIMKGAIMEKILKYFLSLIEWMVVYRQWYEENINDYAKDGGPKPPPPPPPGKPM